MSPAAATRGARVRAALLGIPAAAALVGALDVARAPLALSPVEGAITVLLWALLAAPAAVTGALLAAIFGGRGGFGRIRTASHGAGRPGRVAAGALAAAVAAGFALGVVRAERGPSPTPIGDTAPGPTPTSAVAGERPNVVLIVLDTQRADFLGPWRRPGDGLPPDLTPRFDALVTESTVYERAFATASWTVPSHASLFTGLYARQHGASFAHHRWLDDGFTTLAEAFQGAGYRTISLSSNRYLDSTNLLQGFDMRLALGERFRGLWLRRALEVLGVPARWMDHGAADAVHVLPRVLPGRPRDERPVFLFVNLLEPHWRHFPPLADRIRTLPPGVDVLTATRISASYYGPAFMASGPAPGPVRETMRGLYAASVRYQDRQLGRFLDELAGRLDLSRTVLVVTSDHGENLGDGGRWDHVFAVNDSLIHVPLLVRYPERFPAGRRESGLCQLVDVAATLADLVPGISLPVDPSARTLVPGRFVPREHVVAEGDPYLDHLAAMSVRAGFQRDVARFAHHLRAVRDERHKLVWSSSGAPPALFEPASDPEEVRDLRDARPEEAARLEGVLAGWLEERAGSAYALPDDAGATDRGPGLSEAERQRLESLGYLR